MMGTNDTKTKEMVASLYGPEPVASAPVPTAVAPERTAPAPVAVSEEKRDLSLDRPNVRAVVSMEVRMSGIDQCMRRLAYEAKEIEPSDEIPTRNRALMEMGNYLEPLVKQLMREDGWEVANEEAVELPHGRIILTGHPDGVARHPVKTSGAPAVIEVKTRSVSMAEYAWEVGVERTHPESVRQAALYSMALFGEVRDVVVVTMARDSGEYKAERIPADRAKEAFDGAMKRVTEIGRMVLRGEIPEPERPQGDSHCQSCPFRTLCGNAEMPENPGEGGLTDEELEAQLKAWIDANSSAPKTSSPATKAKKAASETIKAHLVSTGELAGEMVIDGKGWNMKVSEKPAVSIDMDAFNELVAPEVREQVVLETVRRTLRITPVKKK
ncbi:MAG: PD-(D/E)XK nuclease family protein [Chloroflexi bacterium]|nr:PD-(D/E)XK nuclease family protein [Chloroflexota bacterium]